MKKSIGLLVILSITISCKKEVPTLQMQVIKTIPLYYEDGTVMLDTYFEKWSTATETGTPCQVKYVLVNPEWHLIKPNRIYKITVKAGADKLNPVPYEVNIEVKIEKGQTLIYQSSTLYGHDYITIEGEN